MSTYNIRFLKIYSTQMPKPEIKKTKKVAIIVAHPDDETLWAGGTILMHPEWDCFIVSLCRRSDIERASKFSEVLKIFHAEGIMGDLDDGPDQVPLDDSLIGSTVLDLLPKNDYDIIISHNPSGEYTRHIRHEETGTSVMKLWQTKKLHTTELWTFAYEDGKKQYFPKPIEYAPVYNILAEHIWNQKYKIITETYGFNENSWEANTTPRAESFWRFTNSEDATTWLNKGGILV